MMVGNWKMHTTHLETIQMVQKLSYRLDPDDYERVDAVVAPPFTALRSAQTVIEAGLAVVLIRVVDRTLLNRFATKCLYRIKR